MSDIITYVKVTKPPPPTPCMDRPTRRAATLFAAEARTVPTLKRNSAVRRTDLRPMMWENCAQVGWKTVEVRRNEVPHQKACIAVVPLSSTAIV